jgi:hypothetical protein
VFTKNKETFSSWILTAFDYILEKEVDLINFSIGGLDFTDDIFKEKIRIFINRGTTFIAAVGNDGPYFGTVNTPADMLEVISVGGLGIDG